MGYFDMAEQQVRLIAVGCDHGGFDRKEHVVYAKKGVYAKIIDQSGIATQLVSEKKYYSPTTVFPLDEATIELENCSKEGWYIIEYYTKNVWTKQFIL